MVATSGRKADPLMTATLKRDIFSDTEPFPPSSPWFNCYKMRQGMKYPFTQPGMSPVIGKSSWHSNPLTGKWNQWSTINPHSNKFTMEQDLDRHTSTTAKIQNGSVLSHLHTMCTPTSDFKKSSVLGCWAPNPCNEGFSCGRVWI